MVKIKNNGQVAWVKNYSDPDFYQDFFAINQTSDGKYLISGGYANDEDIFPTDPDESVTNPLEITRKFMEQRVAANLHPNPTHKRSTDTSMQVTRTVRD